MVAGSASWLSRRLVSARKPRLHPVPARRGETKRKQHVPRMELQGLEVCRVGHGGKCVWSLCGRVSPGITNTKKQQQQLCQWQNEERGAWWGEGESTGSQNGDGLSLFYYFLLFPFFPSPRPCRKLSILAARSAALYPSVGNPWAQFGHHIVLCRRTGCWPAGCGRLLWGGMWGELQSTPLRHRLNHAGLPTRGRAGLARDGHFSHGWGRRWPALLATDRALWIPRFLLSVVLACGVAARVVYAIEMPKDETIFLIQRGNGHCGH